jgi:AmmeMemoRadiSam system protein B
MTSVIKPSCVGRFFAADAESLRKQVSRLLRAATPSPCCPKAIIAPHAAYDYSGPIAAASFACLAGQADTIRRVVLLGTCHTARTAGIVTTTVDCFITPLGKIPVDQDAVAQSMRLPHVRPSHLIHNADHALAVQLPMLQLTLRDFEIVPLLVGICRREDVEELLELLWGDKETLIVVSSDLSHHLSYEEACRRDQQTAQAIMQLDAGAIGPRTACGYRAIAGLLEIARRHNLRTRQLALGNSGDTSSCREYVVGYGAFAFEAEHGEK